MKQQNNNKLYLMERNMSSCQ